MAQCSLPSALITGASSGIGYQFARRLAAEKYDLILVARNRKTLDKVARELQDEFGVSCEVLRADLGRSADCRRVESRLTDPGVDLLVNHDGFGLYEGDFIEHDIEAEEQLLMVNVRAVLRLTYAALGPMLEREQGDIINVLSVASFAPDGTAPTYAASKAWVTMFTQGLRDQVSGEWRAASGPDSGPGPDRVLGTGGRGSEGAGAVLAGSRRRRGHSARRPLGPGVE